MSFIYKDRVRVNCTPSGTGTINLGSVPTGYRSFTDAGYVNGDPTIIGIVVPTTGEWEICETTWITGDSVTRGAVIASSTGTQVNFGGGAAGIVFVGWSATQVLFAKTVGVLTALGSVQGTAAPIVKDYTKINGGAADTGVILPSTAYNALNAVECVIKNTTASNKKVYPNSGSAIDTAVADAAVDLPSNVPVRFVLTGAAQWDTF